MISPILLVGKRNDCLVVLRSNEATTGTVTVTIGDSQLDVVTRPNDEDIGDITEECWSGVLDIQLLETDASYSCTVTLITYRNRRIIFLVVNIRQC